MTDPLPIQPISRPIDATVELPGSKSITNRALIIAALADGRSKLEGALFSDDTRYMAESLNRLGITVTANEGDNSFTIDGQAGRIPVKEANLYIGNSGTSARFLTALVALADGGEYHLDGNERMRERPISDLLDTLQQFGIDAKSDLDNGCLPVTVRFGKFRLHGGLCKMRGGASSQYLTAMLLIGPATEGIEVMLSGSLSSQPYIDLTIRMMEHWGAKVWNDRFRRFMVLGGHKYRSQIYRIEPDASAASYFFAAAAVCGGRARVPGLGAGALQGDVAFIDILEKMGCQVTRGDDHLEVAGDGKLRGVEVDMNGISDTVMTLAAIAPFADSPTTIRNVAHIRLKETDRIQALANELARIGVTVEQRKDGLTIHPAKEIRPAAIETYDDHRIAMSFAITGLRSPGISIVNPGCVAKTFPDFFARLKQLY